MLKRSTAILSIVMGMVIFLLGCSKANHETLAFIGDESNMKSCYEIYPENYFPNGISQELMEGRFPPDIVGEYEMNGDFVDGYYEYYNQFTHQYVKLPDAAFNPKTMCIIIEDQVNGMAKIRFSFKKNNDYKVWYETNAYIYGNVFSENSNDFMICFENTEGSGICEYYRGNIVKGRKDETGIVNIDTWSVIKDRNFSALVYGIYNVGGYEHYHANVANKKTK